MQKSSTHAKIVQNESGNREKSSRPYVQVGESARRAKKTGPGKKRTSWARQRQQITEAADGGARACTGADDAVVLNLRCGPGAYVHFDYNQPPSARAPTTTSCCATGGRSSCAPCRAKSAADQAGQELLPRQRVPGPRAEPQHASLQSALLCRARFFAEHASLQLSELGKYVT